MDYSYLLNDILQVGPRKPMEYAPQYTVVHHCNRSVQGVLIELMHLGHLAEVVPQEECQILSGAVYACSPVHLRALLDENLDILKESGWPVDARAFMLRVAHEWVEPGVAIFDLIGKAFGDPLTRGCAPSDPDVAYEPCKRGPNPWPRF